MLREQEERAWGTSSGLCGEARPGRGVASSLGFLETRLGLRGHRNGLLPATCASSLGTCFPSVSRLPAPVRALPHLSSPKCRGVTRSCVTSPLLSSVHRLAVYFQYYLAPPKLFPLPQTPPRGAASSPPPCCTAPSAAGFMFLVW